MAVHTARRDEVAQLLLVIVGEAVHAPSAPSQLCAHHAAVRSTLCRHLRDFRAVRGAELVCWVLGADGKKKKGPSRFSPLPKLPAQLIHLPLKRTLAL